MAEQCLVRRSSMIPSAPVLSVLPCANQRHGSSERWEYDPMANDRVADKEPWRVLRIYETRDERLRGTGSFHLAVSRPSGSIVQIPMDDRALLSLIEDAAKALRKSADHSQSDPTVSDPGGGNRIGF